MKIMTFVAVVSLFSLYFHVLRFGDERESWCKAIKHKDYEKCLRLGAKILEE